MTTREQEAIEIAAKAAFDAFYAEGTPYTDIERAMFKQVAGAVYDALLAAGVIPAEGMVVVDENRFERMRALCSRARTYERIDGERSPAANPRRKADAIAAIVAGVWSLHDGDLDAIPDAPTGEGER